MVRFGAFIRFDPQRLWEALKLVEPGESRRGSRLMPSARSAPVTSTLTASAPKVGSAFVPPRQANAEAPSPSTAPSSKPVPSRSTPALSEPTFSTKETARLLHLSTATIYKLCDQGKLRHARNGLNAIRVTESAIKEFQSKTLVETQGPTPPVPIPRGRKDPQYAATSPEFTPEQAVDICG